MPPRRTETCSKPAFESISTALDERFSLRQMVTIGLSLMSVSSGIFADSSAIGILVAPAIWPSGPRNSSVVRTSSSVIASPLSNRWLRLTASVYRRSGQVPQRAPNGPEQGAAGHCEQRPGNEQDRGQRIEPDEEDRRPSPKSLELLFQRGSREKFAVKRKPGNRRGQSRDQNQPER